jgi:hypothetical protein
VIPLKKNLREKIITLQIDDDWYKEVKYNIEQDTIIIPNFEGYSLENDGLLRYNDIIYVPPNDKLRNFIFSEARRVVYKADSGVMKMKTNLKPLFFSK